MSVDHSDLASPVVVQRWKRYGHDRTYVKVGEQALGYRDLTMGVVQCDRAELVETVTQATADLYARASVAAARAYAARHGAPEVHEVAQQPDQPTIRAQQRPRWSLTAIWR